MTSPLDDLIDAALARQRARIAADLDAWADDPNVWGVSDQTQAFRAGVRKAAARVRGGRTVDVPR